MIIVILTEAQIRALRAAVEIAGEEGADDGENGAVVAAMWDADQILKLALSATTTEKP